jgi:glutathione S-transferase
VLELYNAPQSTCSQKVRLALHEKGVAWTDRRVDLARMEQLSDWYLALNPNGVVPTLVHDGRPVVDSSVINEYLDEVFPEPALLPADPFRRAELRAWRQYIDEVPTPAIRVPSFNRVILTGYRGMTDAEFEANAERRPLREKFYKRMGRGGFGEADMEAAMDDLRKTVLRLDAALQKSEWIVGDSYSIADLSLLPTIVRLDDLGLAGMWADLPRVEAWYRRAADRPSFTATYYPGSRMAVGAAAG